MFCLFWPRIFIFCFVYATEKLDYMLKTEIASKIRIRSEIWNFSHLGRISIEILNQKSGIRKSSSSSRRCRTPELEFWLIWKPTSWGARRNKNQPLGSKKIRKTLVRTREMRIRSEIWNFSHLGRILFEILNQKSGIRKSSSSSRRCRSPELEFWFVW